MNFKLFNDDNCNSGKGIENIFRQNNSKGLALPKAH